MVGVATPKHLVGDTIDLAAMRLDPMIQKRLDSVLHGLDWTVILLELDRLKGMPPKNYSRTDFQVQLRILTERLGDLKFPFDDQQRTVSTLGSELRIVRNAFAHGGTFTWLDAWRAGDFVVRLLGHLGDVEGETQVRALRDAALAHVAAEQGITLEQATDPGSRSTEDVVNDAIADDTDVAVATETSPEEPPAEAFETDYVPGRTQGIGKRRQPFQPWRGVLAGPSSVIDELPRKAAKMQVRAVATEVVAFEGPIEIERLSRLTAAAFGWSRLAPKRITQIARQIKQLEGCAVDEYGFVWPLDLDRDEWGEFRPQASDSPRTFAQVSPHEIANAARRIRRKHPEYGDADLQRAVIAVFGRSRMTAATTKHLKLGLAMLD